MNDVNEQIPVEKRLCVICGSEIDQNISENVVTCKRECRDEHAKNMMRLNNENMKEKNIREIIEFAESKIKTGCDIDRIVSMVMSTNIHNIPFDDFVFTSYYLVNKERSDVAVTKSDVNKIAFQWDVANGLERTKKYKKKLKKKLKILEEALPKSKGRENRKKIENKIKMTTRLLKSTPDFGFNDNANKILLRTFGITFGDLDDEIISLINQKWNLFSRMDNVLDEMPNHFLEECKEIYFKNKNKFFGRNPTILVAGIFYFVYRKYNVDITTDVVAITMGVSKPSVEDVLSIIDNG